MIGERSQQSRRTCRKPESVTTGGLFCATARHPSWANAICGGHGSDTFWPLPSPGSFQHPESLVINAETGLTRSAQDPVLITGLFMFTGASVGATAFTEFKFARVEMRLEVAPFLLGWFAVLGLGPQGAPCVEEGPVGADDFLTQD